MYNNLSNYYYRLISQENINCIKRSVRNIYRRWKLEVSSKVTKCVLRDHRFVICESCNEFQQRLLVPDTQYPKSGRIGTREEVWVCAPCVHCGLPCANFSKFIRHAVNAKSGPNSTICNDSRSKNVNVNSSWESLQWTTWVLRPTSVGKGQYQGMTRRHSLRFFSANLRNVNMTIDFFASASSSLSNDLNNHFFQTHSWHTPRILYVQKSSSLWHL